LFNNYYSFFNIPSKGVGRKISKGGGAIEKSSPRNNSNKLPTFMAGYGRTGHTPRAHLQGTLHQKWRLFCSVV